MMVGYYLGDEVEVLDGDPHGWVFAVFKKDRKQRRWRMWGEQIKTKPWGKRSPTYQLGVVEWDEYLQGYNADSKLVICICGVDLRLAENQPHYCPYDEWQEEQG